MGKARELTDFMEESPHLVKEFPKRRGDLGEVIPIYKIKNENVQIRDYFAKILEIREEDGVFLHYLEKLPGLSHEEKLRRARQ